MVALLAMATVVDSGGRPSRWPRRSSPPSTTPHQRHPGDLGAAGTLTGDTSGTQVVLLTGSASTASRRDVLQQIATGQAGNRGWGPTPCSTRAVQFADLGLVVVDEQHRFGWNSARPCSSAAPGPPSHTYWS